MLEDETVSLDQLAGVLGVNSRNLKPLINRGVIIRVKRGAYALGPSIRRYCAHLREEAGGRDHVKAGSGLAAERERETREKADALALKNAAARGELVRAADVESHWAHVLRKVRSAMLALPSRVQQRLGHLSAHDVSVLDREIRDTLEELSDDPI